MEFDEVVRQRRMCRNFLDRPVDPVVVDRLLARARRAPSAGHTQGWAFVVLEGRAQTDRFWQLDADPAWLANPTHPGLLRAPVIILPLAGRDEYLARYAEADKLPVGRADPEGWPAPYWVVDTAFATMVLLLGAVDEGLGALFFALHAPPAQTLAAFGVPDGWEALGAVALGWPAADHRPSSSAARGRRPHSEVVHRGGW
ncbi:nitroreductase family protein [Acidiferrimicrobium sp. IK]|uniref:nitroreductase family protein n=1 Tax=Acidiferrimicrobium sp. IK TaxID=2871700 RepID=UPI0021CB877A|nr:nitroreductase family protein [Acidiferrimicrobium sp. IK]MCU4186549.1 nitroreductase family protein [Acidiferrimicrobium sp. IK]